MKIPVPFKEEVKTVFKAWLDLLAPEEKNAPLVGTIGAHMSAVQVLDEIERETDFGQEYLAALFRLHTRLLRERPYASIATFFQVQVAAAASHR